MKDFYTYEKDVSGDKKLEASLRQSINNWANGIPHHPYSNLGDKITVKSIWYKPSYPVQLRSQYEERAKFKDHEPFTGQKIPSRKYHELSDFNSWDIPLVEIKDFEESTNNYYVNGSQYVADCHHCDARGWITCNTCHGHGTITCPVCHGSKEILCSSCGGHGDNRCSVCEGTGNTSERVARTRPVLVNPGHGEFYRDETYYETVRKRCHSCGGSGRKTCRTCDGTGKVTCSTCGGRGIVTCPTCSGSGRLTCPICKGHKKLMHHFYVERKLDFIEQRTCVIHEEIYDSFPQFLDEFPDYESKNVYSKKVDALPKDPLPENHSLNSYINKFIKKAKKDVTDTHSMQFQQVDIFCIDTWELRYSFKGKDYVMAFTGSNYEIIPGLSPIYEVAFTYWNKGISASRYFMYSRASRFLTKASKINVFEIKEKVETALEEVKIKLDQSYSLGSVIAGWLMAFFGAFVAYTYYSRVNYMFDYASFVNNPDNFLYGYHAWTQTLFSVFLVYLAYISSKSLVKRIGHHIPSALLRILTGFLFTTVFSAIFLVAWGLLNATGISIIITFIVWLVFKILKILYWVILIIISLVIAVAKITWSILIWLWALVF